MHACMWESRAQPLQKARSYRGLGNAFVLDSVASRVLRAGEQGAKGYITVIIAVRLCIR